MVSRTLAFVSIAALLGVSACSRSETTEASAPGPSAGSAVSQAQAVESTPPDSPETETEAQPPTSFDSPPAVGTRVFCPVMRHAFTVTETTERSEHAGRHYAFCCGGCKPRFDANPTEFLAASAAQ